MYLTHRNTYRQHVLAMSLADCLGPMLHKLITAVMKCHLTVKYVSVL